jgi:hypothetical protein
VSDGKAIRNHRPKKKLHSKHSILPDALDWIKSMEDDPKVKGIIPGRIYRKKSSHQNGPKKVCDTITGTKYIFHAPMVMQEFLIIGES